MRMIDHESPPEGEHSATCKVGEVGECVTRTVRQVDHDLLEQCVPIVRRNVARHQFVPWKCQLLFVCVQPNQPLTFGKVEDKDFWRALPVRTREGSCLTRVDHPQSAKRINLRSGCSTDIKVLSPQLRPHSVEHCSLPPCSSSGRGKDGGAGQQAEEGQEEEWGS